MDEAQIENMSYNFFMDVLEHLGYMLEYNAIVNYAGNAFCEDAWDMIYSSNPINIVRGERKSKSDRTLLGILESADVKIGKVVIPGKDEGNEGTVGNQNESNNGQH